MWEGGCGCVYANLCGSCLQFSLVFSAFGFLAEGFRCVQELIGNEIEASSWRQGVNAGSQRSRHFPPWLNSLQVPQLRQVFLSSVRRMFNRARRLTIPVAQWPLPPLGSTTFKHPCASKPPPYWIAQSKQPYHPKAVRHDWRILSFLPVLIRHLVTHRWQQFHVL